jgi:hypothetical protein
VLCCETDDAEELTITRDRETESLVVEALCEAGIYASSYDEW